MSAQLGCTCGLPKIHKVFTNIPKFCPIIDMTNMSYYKIGHLSSLLQQLTVNNYTHKDSFDTANKINPYIQKYLKTDISFCHLILSLYSQMSLSIKPSIIFQIKFIGKIY